MAWGNFQSLWRTLVEFFSLPLLAEEIHRVEVKAVKAGNILIRLKRRNGELFVWIGSYGNESSPYIMNIREFKAFTEAMLATQSVIDNLKTSG